MIIFVFMDKVNDILGLYQNLSEDEKRKLFSKFEQDEVKKYFSPSRNAFAIKIIYKDFPVFTKSIGIHYNSDFAKAEMSLFLSENMHHLWWELNGQYPVDKNNDTLKIRLVEYRDLPSHLSHNHGYLFGWDDRLSCVQEWLINLPDFLAKEVKEFKNKTKNVNTIIDLSHELSHYFDFSRDRMLYNMCKIEIETDPRLLGILLGETSL